MARCVLPNDIVVDVVRMQFLVRMNLLTASDS